VTDPRPDLTPPATANTGAIAAMGLELQDGLEVPRKQVLSWALWDWATQPFNSVILTFVFSVYLTSDLFLPDGVAGGTDENAVLTSGFGLAVGAAGVLIALLAPVIGQRSDVAGRRKLNLAIATGLLVVTTAALFFVEADYSFFWLGAILVGVGSVFSEIAGVNYNGLLVRVSTPKTVGRISGLGWGFGYLGGIVALVIVIVMQQNDWLGIPTEDGLHIRLVALGCAVWTVLFSIPIFLNVPEPPPAAHREKVGFFRSYVVLAKDIARIFRETRPTFWFLLASAVFRDGLAGVFTFGAIIAAVVFGFSADQVIIFGVAANLVAGAGRTRGVLPAGSRHDGVLGRRADPVPLRRSGPGSEPLVPGPGHPGRPRRRDLRSVRDDRARRELPLAACLGRRHRAVRQHLLRRPRHRAHPAGGSGAHDVRPPAEIGRSPVSR
jgi:MFS transporter, UMF1 family